MVDFDQLKLKEMGGGWEGNHKRSGPRSVPNLIEIFENKVSKFRKTDKEPIWYDQNENFKQF